MNPLVATTLVLSAVWLTASLVACIVVNSRARARVGPLVEAHVPTLVLRRLGAFGLVATVFWAVASRDAVPLTWTVPCLLLALAVQFFRPHASLREVGEEGVRVGWYSRRFAEVEEWRLTGDHLRFRLFGIWRAAELGHGHHAKFRERLQAVAGDRESGFRD